MNDDIKKHIKEQSTWVRGVYMLMFALFYSIAEFVLFGIVIVQFLLVLFTGSNNQKLLILGQSIATYIYQIVQFLTFNSEYQAFPFGEWPKGKASDIERLENI